MINQENHDLYDLNEALKVENLTLNDYEEINQNLDFKDKSFYNDGIRTSIPFSEKKEDDPWI